MELQAKVIQFLPLQSGTSRAGKSWQSQDVIVETLGNYPKKVSLKFFGEKALEKASRLINGQVYTFHIDIESREHQGRFYTSVNCYHVADGVGQGAPQQTLQQSAPPVGAQYIAPTASPSASPSTPAYPQPAYGAPAPGYPQQGYPQTQQSYPPSQQAYGQPLFPPDQTDAKESDLPF